MGERKASFGSSRGRRFSLPGVRSVAGQMFVLQVVVVAVLIVAAVVALALQVRRNRTMDARHRTLDVAQAFAQAPGTAAALTSANPTAILQPRAEKVRKSTDIDFVVVFSTTGIRYTHPDPKLIGKHVVGPYKSAITHGAFTRTFTASQGPAVDSIVPVMRPDGKVVGLVSVAITVADVESAANRQLPVLLGAAAGVLVLAAGSSVLVSRRLRRQTHGLGPAEMTRMYEHHDAVLHAVREGVVIVDQDGRLLLANDEARRLLELPADAEGRPVAELGLAPAVAELLGSLRPASDEVHRAGDRLLGVNVRPAADGGGRPAMYVATLRDTTELAALTGRAEMARGRLTLLYEAGVRIGTTLDAKRTAEELAEVTMPRFADLVTVDLADAVVQGQELGWASTEMHRVALRGVRADAPVAPVGDVVQLIPTTQQTEGPAPDRGGLIADLRTEQDWRTHDPERAAMILDHGLHSLIAVPLLARGTVLGRACFWRSEQAQPFEADDLSFAEELAARAAVCLDNARRFTREHGVAVALQRSLLPRGLSGQTAVEAAHRYLPAQTGVGGDWFDVIPLPGARVALVVGDVVGHGLHAAATMGRLRTAVHNFSALDLAPDELLGYLDELVVRIDADEGTGDEWPGVTGATCLYAVYDPVAGHCRVARAGHLGPALVHPDGTVTFPDVPLSPPLGLGGQPFEIAELSLAEGSQLVLYTDGLVEDRDRDVDTGLDLLREALTGHPGRGPEQTCQAVIDSVLLPQPSDDVALLVARTRLLGPGQVAEWEVPSDPAAVASVRNDASRQLADWGLDEIAFTTELILSELITNAIRYGTPPVRVRLLRDRTLICEVSDGSSTSPHLRQAKSTDEGGRGLFLVARLAQHWGTRYTPTGKVIWTEQALHNGTGEVNLDLADLFLEHGVPPDDLGDDESP
ncbi:SpoIIE family protein phosphatase/ATP-binding protein [Streptomyces sp. NBC_01306]|uniref:SpoIIE family protein phosphatase/ATP-binding protein n=1 Tax=Streptomyces sp. NBC_01306 TaxID=2903819 RepID=UPI00225BFDD2|nr:SpoIIE family protein phosphatase/ATP-binding protein [Streptomyces sp. NBC_01306]MCX4728079.1 SpoIIE family protein phosphatase [Streptomyces sp. NBC_01306]